MLARRESGGAAPPAAAPVRDVPIDLDFLAHLRRESARFAGVQQVWGEVVRRGVTDKAEADRLEGSDDDRPATRAGLEGFYRRSSADLAQVLTETDPSTTAWTWSTEQSVGFISAGIS